MKRRGYMFTDALLALMVLAAAAALLIGVLRQVDRVERRINDQLLAARHAERVLTALQTGEARPEVEGVRIQISDLTDTRAPAGWKWVRVTCVYHQSQSELTGLARSGS